MKDYLRNMVEMRQDSIQKRSLVREYLQARILQIVQDNGAFLNWAFLGGTALRFLYGIPRYSEDLDFSLVDYSKESEFDKVTQEIIKAFESEDYTVSVKSSIEKMVQSAFIRFAGIFYEMDCSPHADEILSIKIEIDTRPPEGAGTETTIIRRFVTVNVNHYDKSSLFAGKLHALLSRNYTKGRDLYDLIWYLSDRSWPDPNLRLLNNALEQTGWNGTILSADNWRNMLVDRLSEINWSQVKPDLMPFLERQEDLSLVTYENYVKLLRSS